MRFRKLLLLLSLAIPIAGHAQRTNFEIKGTTVTAQSSPQELEILGEGVLQELDAVSTKAFASDLTPANAARAQRAQEAAVLLGGFLLSQPNSMAGKGADELGAELFEKLGESVERISEPFTDFKTESANATVVQRMGASLVRFGEVFKFWLVPRVVVQKFGGTKEETVLESFRRTGLLQDTMKELNSQYEAFQKQVGSQLRPDHPMVRATERLLAAARKSEPYVNLQRSRITMGVIAASFVYLACMPREVHLFPIDFFFERNWGSYGTARLIWGAFLLGALFVMDSATGYKAARQIVTLGKAVAGAVGNRDSRGSRDPEGYQLKGPSARYSRGFGSGPSAEIAELVGPDGRAVGWISSLDVALAVPRAVRSSGGAPRFVEDSEAWDAIGRAAASYGRIPVYDSAADAASGLSPRRKGRFGDAPFCDFYFM